MVTLLFDQLPYEGVTRNTPYEGEGTRGRSQEFLDEPHMPNISPNRLLDSPPLLEHLQENARKQRAVRPRVWSLERRSTKCRNPQASFLEDRWPWQLIEPPGKPGPSIFQPNQPKRTPMHNFPGCCCSKPSHKHCPFRTSIHDTANQTRMC